MLTYHNGDNHAIDEVEWENEFFTLRRIRPYHSDVWSYVEHYPQRLSREWMAVSPGSDPYLEHAYLAKYGPPGGRSRFGEDPRGQPCIRR